jgi:hypothetical protein
MDRVAEYLPAFFVVVVVGALQGVKYVLGEKAEKPKVKGAMYFGAWVLSGAGAVVVTVVKGDNPFVDLESVMTLATWIALRAMALYDGGKAVLVRLLKVF